MHATPHTLSDPVSDHAQLSYMMPTFVVDDLDRAIDHYVNTLGFEERWRYPQGQATEAQVMRGGVELMLSKRDPGPNRRGPSSGTIFVDGIHEYHDEVASRLPRCLPLRDTPYGMREFEVPDPDGNWLTFGESISRVSE
ncbi:MAG: VOC family protein [Planctomycetota bacterium]